jgi:hydroxymethylbilane synthase
MNHPLRLGTRGSPLALAQARLVADALRQAHGWGDEAVEIVPITTTGDVIQDRPLAEIGGKALWTKELDRCLADGRTDLSVHSMKDVETFRPAEFVIAAMLKRADARDRIVGADSLASLPANARLGTSSPRRAAQVKARRHDVETVVLRGNVQTRLAKLQRGEIDATLLAAAGLDRLGLDVGKAVDELLPAASQGAIGVEVLAAREDMLALIGAIDDRTTHACVSLERRFLAEMGGDCHSPLAVHAFATGDRIVLRAEILSADGREVQAGEVECGFDEAEAAARLARRLLDAASPQLRALFAA